jgi:hypothetical protein
MDPLLAEVALNKAVPSVSRVGLAAYLTEISFLAKCVASFAQSVSCYPVSGCQVRFLRPLIPMALCALFYGPKGFPAGDAVDAS